MLFDPCPFDFCRRMTGKAVTAAIGHFFGIGGMAFDTGFHRTVPGVGIDRLEELGVAAHAITRASPYRQQ